MQGGIFHYVPRVGEPPMLAGDLRRVEGFYAPVQSYDKVIKIEP